MSLVQKAVFRRTIHSFSRTFPAKMSTSQSTEPTTAAALPWHAAYPAPRKAEQQGTTREEVLVMLKSQLGAQNSGDVRDFVLVDLRRVDHEVRPSPPFLTSSPVSRHGRQVLLPLRC